LAPKSSLLSSPGATVRRHEIPAKAGVSHYTPAHCRLSHVQKVISGIAVFKKHAAVLID
jgi:hypothetical protein